MLTISRGVAAGLIAISLTGCVSANDIANRLGQPPEQSTKLRALETRRFDTRDDVRLISTATQTMQDLGFIISESSLDGSLALLWQFFRFHRYRLRFAFPIRNSYPTDIPRKVPLN